MVLTLRGDGASISLLFRETEDRYVVSGLLAGVLVVGAVLGHVEGAVAALFSVQLRGAVYRAANPVRAGNSDPGRSAPAGEIDNKVDHIYRCLEDVINDWARDRALRAPDQVSDSYAAPKPAAVDAARAARYAAA